MAVTFLEKTINSAAVDVCMDETGKQAIIEKCDKNSEVKDDDGQQENIFNLIKEYLPKNIPSCLRCSSKSICISVAKSIFWINFAER